MTCRCGEPFQALTVSGFRLPGDLFSHLHPVLLLPGGGKGLGECNAARADLITTPALDTFIKFVQPGLVIVLPETPAKILTKPVESLRIQIAGAYIRAEATVNAGLFGLPLKDANQVG